MLTDAQKTDVRRWLGYPTLNAGYPDTIYTTAWSRALFPVSLTAKLDALTSAEESVLTTTFLATLAPLEAAIAATSDSLDTKAAGPWERNPNEVVQRTALFNKWRRDMAAFLGFAPGPALGGGGLRIERC